MERYRVLYFQRTGCFFNDYSCYYNYAETKVDFTASRNVIIAALILVLSIGINYSAAGAIAFNIGSATISLSGLAVGSLVGIILNAVLPGKDYKFDEEKPDNTGVNFEV